MVDTVAYEKRKNPGESKTISWYGDCEDQRDASCDERIGRITGCMIRLDVYFSEYGKNGLPGKGNGRYYRAEREQITKIAICEFCRKADVEPVLETHI
jgi:hypothetical protein